MATLAFPFICLPDAAIWRPGLTAHAKVLFAALISCRNRRTGLCNPRLATLAERLEISLRTIKRALAELCRAGMIIVHRTLVGNRYDVAPPALWQEATSSRDIGAKCGPTMGPSVAPSERSLLIEPDVINQSRGDAAAATCVSTPVEAAAAVSTSCECTEPKTAIAPAPTEAEKLVAELMPQHPEPGNARKAIAAAGKLLATRPEGIPATVEAVRRNHALWQARWAEYAPGRFIPQLWRWLHDGDWENPPVNRKAVKSESWVERREREYQESKEKSYRMYAENGMWEALREYGGDELVEVWRAKVEAAS